MSITDPAPAASETTAARARSRFTRRQEALTISWLRSLSRSSTATATPPAQPAPGDPEDAPDATAA